MTLRPRHVLLSALGAAAAFAWSLVLEPVDPVAGDEYGALGKLALLGLIALVAAFLGRGLADLITFSGGASAGLALSVGLGFTRYHSLRDAIFIGLAIFFLAALIRARLQGGTQPAARRRSYAPAGRSRSPSVHALHSRPERRGANQPRPRSRQPARFGAAELERRLGTSVAFLRATPRGYRTYEIAKRGSGKRTIRAPNPDLKVVQRLILHRLLEGLPAHEAAHGFQRRRSIVSNAGRHVGRAVIVQFDLADFFDSTSAGRMRRYFRVIGWDGETSQLLADLCTDRGSLPQGAPTSPRLANLVNLRLDARLTALAAALGATYTRYADDLTFSFGADAPRATHRLIRAVERICAHEGYRLHKQRKLHIRRRHEQQRVTGLVVNDRVALPRATRRWLRAIEHHRALGRASTLSDAQLRGWYAFEEMVERGGAAAAGRPT